MATTAPPKAPIRPPTWGSAPEAIPIRIAAATRTMTTASKRFTRRKYGRRT
jgi:hypothetical protein